MKLSLGHYLGVSIQTEIVFMTICGILLSPFDESLTNLNTNLQIIWGTDFLGKYVTPFSAHVILSIISGIVVIRSFTLHLYLAFYVVMLWPAIFGEKPSFLIPWIIIGGIKILLMRVLCLLTGIVVCVISKNYNRIMTEFIFSNVLKLSLSFYMWTTVIRFYKMLKSPFTIEDQQMDSDSKLLFEIAVRRHLVRSMASEGNIRQRLLKNEQDESSSSDSSPWSNSYNGMSALNIESMFSSNSKEITRTRSLDDYHKPARRLSVGQLSEAAGSYELVFKSNMIPAEKAKKALHLTDSDIEKAKKAKALTNTDTAVNYQPDLCAQIVSKIRTDTAKRIIFATSSEIEIETIDLSLDEPDEKTSKEIIATYKDEIEENKPQTDKVELKENPIGMVSKNTTKEENNKVNIKNGSIVGEPETVSNEKKSFFPKVKNTYRYISSECTNCGGVKSQTFITANDLPKYITLSLKNKVVKEPILVDAACQVSNIRIKYLNSNSVSTDKPRKKLATNPPKTSHSEMKRSDQKGSEGMKSLMKKHTVSLNKTKKLQRKINEMETFLSNTIPKSNDENIM